MTDVRLAAVLSAWHFAIAPVVGKPDQATVLPVPDMPLELLSDSGLPALETLCELLCANQCVRDSGHDCGVPLELGELVNGTWVKLVSAEIPWMVLSWGPHMHQLPFCCVECLVEFVTERAAAAHSRHAHSE
jgi:hypothetical protein